MSDRMSSMASTCGVAVAVVGGALNHVVLSIAGPLFALAVHAFTEWRMGKRQRDTESLLNYLKLENYQLRVELGKFRQSVPEMTRPITIQPVVAPD